MNFVKGKYYTCIKPSTHLTIGRAYENQADSVWCHVTDDNGFASVFPDTHFDPNFPLAGAPGFRHFFGQPTAPPRASLAKPKEPTCWSQAPEKKVFATFSYLFCQKCRKEAGV